MQPASSSFGELCVSQPPGRSAGIADPGDTASAMSSAPETGLRYRRLRAPTSLPVS
jgi:hypothetical protein